MTDGRSSPDTTGEIRVSGLTKIYGNVRAVDDLSFRVEPGRATRS